MEREKTIGIIVFRRQGHAIKFLLLHKRGQYWAFPKGHAEASETELETARRELAEETGITKIKVIDDFKVEYDFDFDTDIKDGVKEKIYKRAVLFLGQTDQTEVKVSDEHLDYGWFDFETALKRAFHQEGQNVLKQAYQFLLKDRNFVL